VVMGVGKLHITQHIDCAPDGRLAFGTFCFGTANAFAFSRQLPKGSRKTFNMLERWAKESIAPTLSTDK